MKTVGKIINLCAIGLVAGIVVTVNVLALDTFVDTIQTFLVGQGTADSETLKLTREEGEALAEDIVEEGVVLLKNDNDVLPLSREVDTKVNVFGWSSTRWIGGGSGSGRVVPYDDENNVTGMEPNTGILEALEKNDIEYNTELSDMYRRYSNFRTKLSQGTLNSYEYEFYRLQEPSINDTNYYSEDLLANAEEYSDTAIVVIGRMAGESSDAPKSQYKGTGTSSTPDDASRTYLEISTEEEELLEYVTSAYENVIVLVNSTNTMELGFIEDTGIDACLFVGATGINAATGIVNVMYGDVSPSGKLVDTFAYDLSTAASYANAGIEGERLYTNCNGLYPADGTIYGNVGNNNARYPGVSYVDYQESIYVGYKWYETADTEGFWDSQYAKDLWNIENGYDDVVQFPFGYGMSYTEFSWEITNLEIPANSTLEMDDVIKVDVNVTNTGTVAGCDVVELYYSAPYYDGEIEKSSVNLGDFAKTAPIEPGKSQTVTLELKVEDMASYDCYDLNQNGATTFELDGGEYNIYLKKDAHNFSDVLNTSFSAHTSNTITYNVPNAGYIYEFDSVTGNEVTNRFTGDDAIDEVSIDGSNAGQDIEFMTRENFEGTFPETLNAARALNDLGKKYNLYTSTHATQWIDPSDEEPVYGADSGLRLYENGVITELGLELGSDFEHSDWDRVLDQLTLTEMRNLTLHGYVKTDAVNSVGKPRFNDADGPAQMGSFNFSKVGTGYPNATTLAQTWNKRLAYNYGLAIGKDARNLGFDGWYGPGMNLHRSPFGGRNYEYYSEDPMLSGVFGAESVRGAKNAGVYAYLKHLAVYDQESYRDGLYTWLTEQAFRENYLRPFKDTVQKGGAGGIMTSYNRVGAMWAGGSTALLTNVLRDEWGFNGTVITDYADHHSFMSMDHALRAGGDLFMDGYLNNGNYRFETNSNSFKQALRSACKHILYTGVNTLYQNSIYNESADEDEVIQIGERHEADESWKIYIYVADGVIGAGLIAWGVLIFVFDKSKKESLNNPVNEEPNISE